MRLDLLTNPTVKAAIEACRRVTRMHGQRSFTPDATMMDDAHPRNLKAFTKDALGHEHFYLYFSGPIVRRARRNLA